MHHTKTLQAIALKVKTKDKTTIMAVQEDILNKKRRLL